MRKKQPNFQSNPIMDTFKLVAKAHRHVNQVTDRAKDIVKKHYKTPEALAAFIESQGTPVYIIRQDFIGRVALSAFGFEFGFIPVPRDEKLRKKYEGLTRLLRFRDPKSICNSDDGVFVITNELFTVGFLAHQLHHWLAFKAGLPGYSDEAKKQYQWFWNEKNGLIESELDKMTVDQIKHLREAVNRDLEALKFIQQVTEELF